MSRWLEPGRSRLRHHSGLIGCLEPALRRSRPEPPMPEAPPGQLPRVPAQPPTAAIIPVAEEQLPAVVPQLEEQPQLEQPQERALP